MDERISLDAIASYGDRYANNVLKDFFSSKDKISGQEIRSFSSVQQINLFIIREMFLNWREETRKIRSPYFDYEHPEVKDALENFMTVLSNHIAIDRENFAPLLKKAVRQTLLLIFNPYGFFSVLISGETDKLNIARLKDELKYLKINKAPLARLVQKFEERNIAEVSGNEAFAALDQILEEVSFTPEDLDEYIKKFSAVLPLDPSSFFTRREQPPAPPKPKPKAENKPRAYVAREGEEEARPILNDKMQSGQRPVVYSNFQKISRIKDNLTINQKFMFTKVLFYGDFESFSRAIDELDNLDNMEDAMKYLESHSANWDRESKEFHEFMELVDRKFAGQ